MIGILRNCGITGKTNLVHALRHTFATTLKIYHHVIEEQKHSAVMELDNLY